MPRQPRASRSPNKPGGSGIPGPQHLLRAFFVPPRTISALVYLKFSAPGDSQMSGRSTSRALLACALLLTAGCARNVRVENEPNSGFAVQVRNTMPNPMIVSYDDGSGARILGT